MIAPAEIRYEMLVAALDGVEGIEASRIQLDREGPTYTIDTVQALAAPDRELVPRGRQRRRGGPPPGTAVDDLRERVALAIVDRDPVAVLDPPGWRVSAWVAPALSSLRPTCADRVAAGEPIDFLVPTPPWDLRARHGGG